MIALFLVAGFWQLDRRDERIAQNTIVAARADGPPISVTTAIASGTPEEVDFRRVRDDGVWLETDLVRVANRSLNGSAGEWVVGLFETADGARVLVNRGFVPSNELVELLPPSGSGRIDGFLRTSREKEGISAEDPGEGTLVPRLNIDAVAERLDDPEVVDMWLQLEDLTASGFPEPIELPEQSNGPHLSYAGQWFLFAAMGAGAYVQILRRIAKPRAKTVVPDFIET